MPTMQGPKMPTEPRPRRSALYVPANNDKAVAKAGTLAADVVILDLEDAVAPDDKPAARATTVAAVAHGEWRPREVFVRANGLATPWGADDLAALVDARVDGIVVPKIDGPADVDRYHAALAAAPSHVGLWVMIETCAAIGSLPAIAARAGATRLAGFVVGINDLAKEMRARLTTDRAPFVGMLALAVAAARASGLGVLDGVCNDFSDLDRFRAECAQGADIGFDGKTLIHPRQIEPCNEIFSPQPGDVAHAHAVVAAFARPENHGKGVITVDGRMVELLHRDRAHELLATVAAIAERQRGAER